MRQQGIKKQYIINFLNNFLYAINYIVDTTKKKSGTREAAIIELEKAVNISKEEAEHLIEKYW